MTGEFDVTLQQSFPFQECDGCLRASVSRWSIFSFHMPLHTFEIKRLLWRLILLQTVEWLIIMFVYVFYFFIFSCSGQGDTFMDPALLDNLREHHVSTSVFCPCSEWAFWFAAKLCDLKNDWRYEVTFLFLKFHSQQHLLFESFWHC